MQVVKIDIRTAKFLENFMCSENYICTLFENKADSYLKKISVRCKYHVVSRYSFRAHLSSCEMSLSLRVSFAFRCSQLLFHFCFMLCCRFWRIKMYIKYNLRETATTLF